MADTDAPFDGFPVAALDFYDDLEMDNTKSFWTAHKEVYDAAVKAPMLALVGALEPDLRSMLDELDADRLARMTDNAEFLHAAGHLRPGITVEHAAELMWSVTSPEMIELLVQRRSWSLEQYAQLVYDVLANGLLPSA